MDYAVTLYDSLAAFVDDRIAKSIITGTAMGTIIRSTPTSVFVDVLFDGSNVTMPVKTFMNVVPKTGDRVGLARFGSDWIVLGTYGHNGLTQIPAVSVATVAGTTTSGTFVDMPGPISFSWTKQFDATLGFFIMIASIDVTGADAQAAIGINVGGLGDAFIASFGLNGVSEHKTMAGMGSTNSPAGTYTLTARWARQSGAGTLRTQISDWVSMCAIEVLP